MKETECVFPNCNSGLRDMLISAKRLIEENPRFYKEHISDKLAEFYPAATEINIERITDKAFSLFI